jgi:putative methyltransferase (TIGR04325 family)
MRAAIRRLLRSGSSDHFVGSYESYEAALAKCPTALHAKESTQDILIDGAVRGYRRFSAEKFSVKEQDRSLPYMAALSLVPMQELRVLDFGGHFGKYYHYLRHVYGERFDPVWDIVEVPEKVSVADRLGQSSRKLFYSNVREIPDKRYTHVILGGVLQLLPSPELVFREVMQTIDWQYLLITDFSLLQDEREDRATIKKKSVDAQEVSHPYYLFGNRWYEIIKEFGEIVLEFITPHRSLMYRGTTQLFRGFIVRSKSKQHTVAG